MAIREEALAVLDINSGLFLPEDENLRETGDWGQFTLWQQGNTHAVQNINTPTCTVTTSLLINEQKYSHNIHFAIKVTHIKIGTLLYKP